MFVNVDKKQKRQMITLFANVHIGNRKCSNDTKLSYLCVTHYIAFVFLIGAIPHHCIQTVDEGSG